MVVFWWGTPLVCYRNPFFLIFTLRFYTSWTFVCDRFVVVSRIISIPTLSDARICFFSVLIVAFYARGARSFVASSSKSRVSVVERRCKHGLLWLVRHFLLAVDGRTRTISTVVGESKTSEFVRGPFSLDFHLLSPAATRLLVVNNSDDRHRTTDFVLTLKLKSTFLWSYVLLCFFVKQIAHSVIVLHINNCNLLTISVETIGTVYITYTCNTQGDKYFQLSIRLFML